MEAQTLLKLIKDDIAHLEGITGEFLLESLPSSDEVELALVRAKALLRELELLHKFTAQHESVSKTIKLAEEPTVEVQEQIHSEQEPFELFDRETGEDEQEIILKPDQQDNEPAEEVQATRLHIADQQNIEKLSDVSFNVSPVEEHIAIEPEPDESAVDAPAESIIEVEEVALVDQEVPVTEETAIVETVIISDIPDNKEEILAEEFSEVKKTLGETLGESHQLVNDILSPEKSETDYPVIPINSIWDGIGINDRFLFIRELFANSSAKFETTVATLDKLATIQDAVSYLKMNFKWNKTEASQKFLALVKRRFTK